MTEKKMLSKGLEQAYLNYPRKLGKGQGMKIALRQIKTKEDLDQLTLAIENFKRFIATESREKRYIPYFSTFMNNWRDWLEEDVGTVKEERPDLSGMGFD